ncbi:DUF3108 domain-containing protein [Glaciecola sp. SC05]|uniref:DUF3108 domain-containing protein n=1 Tax=Glaciecola sp. SC05 TaxID=1987355 RepID=UPI003528FEF3
MNNKISSTIKLISVIFCMLCYTAAFAKVSPFSSSFVAYYDGKDVGEATLVLSHVKDSQYQLSYVSKVSKFFLSDRRYETSIFEVEDNKLIPISYIYKREGTGSNKYLSVSFDRSSDTILVNEQPKFDWNDEMDNQLFRVDLSQRLRDGDSEFSYDFINNRGEQKHYKLEVLGTDNLSLPYGSLSATKVKINRETNKRVTYAWFAPDLDYSLVRFQQFKEGKEQGDIKLQAFTRE